MNKKQVRIIGAGLSGLAAAQYLKELSGDKYEIHVHEGTDRVGGKFYTSDKNGVVNKTFHAFPTSAYAFISLLKSIRLPNSQNAYNFIIKDGDPFLYFGDHSYCLYQFINPISMFRLVGLLAIIDIIQFMFDLLRFKLFSFYHRKAQHTFFGDYSEKFYTQGFKLLLSSYILAILFYDDKLSMRVVFDAVWQSVTTLLKCKNQAVNISVNIQEYIFNPLKRQLEALGVQFHFNDKIKHLEEKKPYSQFKLADGKNETITADAIIIAIDVHNMSRLLPEGVFPTGLKTNLRVVYTIACKQLPDYLQPYIHNQQFKELGLAITIPKYWKSVTTIHQNINFIQSKDLSEDIYIVTVMPQDLKAKGVFGKTMQECTNVEFERDLLAQLQLDPSSVLYFTYPDFVHYNSETQQLQEEPHGNMFVPTGYDYDILPPISTMYPNVFICGDYTQLKDFIFSVQGCCLSAAAAAEASINYLQ